MMSPTSKLFSRKLGALVGAVLVIVFGRDLGMTDAATQSVVAVVVAYLAAQGATDVVGAYKAPTPKAPDGGYEA